MLLPYFEYFIVIVNSVLAYKIQVVNRAMEQIDNLRERGSEWVERD